MKKVLITANLDSFFIKFLIPYMNFFKEKGFEIHIASKEDGSDIPNVYDQKFNVNFARSFNVKQNIESYRQVKKILKENTYDIIFCHTPFGAAITRLAAKDSRKKGTKVIYVAHGFHFFKGAPHINWLLFYSAEKFLSKYTDILLTMNQEDYECASKKFKKTKVCYIPGIGINADKFAFSLSEDEKLNLRRSLNLNEKDFVGIFPAEISDNKGQMWLIKCLKQTIEQHPNIHILLPGKDLTNGKCQKLINELNLQNNIHLLGFRKDIPMLLKIVDFSLSSSKREGLPINILEAICNKLPVVALNCRGMSDLICHNTNGYLIPMKDETEFRLGIVNLYKNNLKNYKEYDEKIIDTFSIENVLKEFEKTCKDYI